MSEKRFTGKMLVATNGEEFGFTIYDEDKRMIIKEVVDLLNEQQELIEELQASDEMGWKRAEKFEKECTKELHNKKMYIKRLEYKVRKFKEENEQLRQELQGMDELLQSYRKTLKHNAGLLADASKNGYLPPLTDYVSTDGWICGCCKHFHLGVRDRCDKDNNWVLTGWSCQDFER